MTRPRRILLLGWQTTIGSGICAIPAIKAVKAHYGVRAELWLLTRPASRQSDHPGSLLASWIGLGGMLFMPRSRNPLAWLRLLLKLWRLRFECAVYVDLSQPRSAVRRRLVRISRLALLGRPVGLQGPPPAEFEARTEAGRRLENLAAEGIVPSGQLFPDQPMPRYMSPSPTDRTSEWLAKRRRVGRRLVAICPGARAQANHWPIKQFAALGARLLARGDCDIMICGSPAERAAALELQVAWGEGILAAGEFDLAATAYLLSECDLVIGLDTGTSHLAAAVGTPVVVIQGGRCPEGLWDPLGRDVAIVRVEVTCAGCGHSQCPLSLHPCMRFITVDMVMKEVQPFLPSLGAPG